MASNSNIGRVFEGKYEIIRQLGAGGMGEVYEANHKLIERRLAIKVLHPEFSKDEEVVRRFQIEAKAAAAVNDRHIVDVTDMGITDTGELFIVMEYLDGTDLETLLQDKLRLSPKRACHIMIQVLAALEAAHAKGIVHRDLKPANIFLINQSGIADYVKIVDFGISKIWDSDTEVKKGLTQEGLMLGTPTYMSPEQARGEASITPATDIFAAGVVLYEMLTGALPFKGDTLTGLLMKILSEPPEDPYVLRPDLPAELGTVIAKALEKAPEDRFSNVAAFRRSITPFSPDTPILTGLNTTIFSRRAAEFVQELSADVAGSLKSPEDSKETIMTPLKCVTSKDTGTRRGLPKIAALVAVAVIALVVAVVLLVPSPRPADTAGPAAASLAPPVPRPPASADQPPEAPSRLPPSKPVDEPRPKEADQVVADARVELHFQVQPQEATVLIDGQQTGTGSFKTHVPPDDEVHHIVIQAPGYQDHEQRVSFAKDLSLVVNLVKASPRSKHRRKAAETPSKPQATAARPKEQPRQKPDPVIKKRTIDEDAPW